MNKVVVPLLLLCACFTAQASNSTIDSAGQTPNPVVQWNQTLLVIVRTPGAQPATIHPTRSFAMMHAAIYDAVNSIDRTHSPYLVQIAQISRRASERCGGRYGSARCAGCPLPGFPGNTGCPTPAAAGASAGLKAFGAGLAFYNAKGVLIGGSA
jgi:hypothetical protein